MRRAPLVAAVVAGLGLAACSSTSDLSLAIRLPDDRHLLKSVTKLNLSAIRDGHVIATDSFSAVAGDIALPAVSHGKNTVVTLEGVSSTGDVIARGNTCPVDFEGPGMSAPLYFAPTNFFAPTVGAPTIARQRPAAVALSDGTVLLTGGFDGTSVLGSSELYDPGSASFTTTDAPALAHARRNAESVQLPSIGLLVTGGVDGAGSEIATGELYIEALQQFLPVSDPLLDARVGHRAVVLSDGRAWLTGGMAGGVTLGTSLFVYVNAKSDGTYRSQVSAGPPMGEPRREHAAIVGGGVLLAFGGYGSDGTVLSSIEVIDPDVGTQGIIGYLKVARAEATASTVLLADGKSTGILVVGGVGSDGKPLATAELYNPYRPNGATTVYEMAVARRGHTATVLSDGRVLVAGGLDASGNAINSVELFASSVPGFLTERTLGTPRGGHVAIPLCDGTVLVVGGGSGAELYSEPAN